MHVYRLVVQLPPGSDAPGWRPAGYDEARFPRQPDDGAPFRWPPRRHYLSWASATTRAALLRSWGATVDIAASAQVRWGVQADQRTLAAEVALYLQMLRDVEHPDDTDLARHATQLVDLVLGAR